MLAARMCHNNNSKQADNSIIIRIQASALATCFISTSVTLHTHGRRRRRLVQKYSQEASAKDGWGGDQVCLPARNGRGSHRYVNNLPVALPLLLLWNSSLLPCLFKGSRLLIYLMRSFTPHCPCVFQVLSVFQWFCRCAMFWSFCCNACSSSPFFFLLFFCVSY